MKISELPPVRRTPDGELLRLTSEQIRKCSGLVKRCCNYVGDECVLLGCLCPQDNYPSLWCRWFQWAVLPNDHELENNILGIESRQCPDCGIIFYPATNRVRLCPRCRARHDRESKRRSARKSRSM